MLILAADTSGKNGSLALVRFENGAQHAFDVVSIEGGTFSAQLVPQIAALLKSHQLSKSTIDAFAVVSGPGSFTGLRVGLAAIKALAETLRKPIAAVSLLEVVALAAGRNGRVVSALDAGRSEIYTGVYEIENSRARCLSETLETMETFTAIAEGKAVVTPDTRLVESLRRSCVNVTLISPPRADSIALLGFARIQAGETVAPELLDATYIRRSDAEIKLSK